MSMTKEAMELLVGRLAERKPEQLYETHNKVHYSRFNGGGFEIVTIDKDLVSRNHTFTSLEGFLDYLNSEHCTADAGPLFVGAEQVLAKLQYGQPGTQQASLPLALSEEYRALLALTKGVKQKELWKLLNTALYESMSPELALQISMIQISDKSTTEVKIDALGLSEAKMGVGIAITYGDPKGNGTQTAKIRTEWDWEGRIWECYDMKFQIRLQLELELDGGLKFVFYPRMLEKVLRDARLDLCERIRTGVPPRFTVHEGKY